MKMNKIMFLNLLIMGTMITISSYSWFSMWMGMEMNLMAMIPLMSKMKNMYSAEASMKYFITQSMASMIMLLSIITSLMVEKFINSQMNFTQELMIESALLTKMGAAPFHYWLPEIIEGLNWINTLIMMTWQKIAPMMMMMNLKTNPTMMTMAVMSAMFISAVSSMNQTSMRKIMVFSSINHMGWMITAMEISTNMWTMYFIIYSLINLNLILMFKTNNTYFIAQLTSTQSKNKMLKTLMMMNFLSLGGMPPFVGFLPKWIMINWMMNNNMMMLAMILVISTLFMIYIYMRTILTTMTLTWMSQKPQLKTNKSKMMIYLNSLTLMGMIMSTALTNPL